MFGETRPMVVENGCEETKVPNYYTLKGKLMLILSENPNLKTFKYTGVTKDNKIGILIDGVDGRGIREFCRFYSIADINFYFNELNKRLSR
jgi:hypothetical protein